MYSGLHDPGRWVLPQALVEQAQARPDAPWITTTDGDSLTFGQAAADARRVAGFFAGLGVRPGDRVAVMLQGGCDFVRVWLGLGTLGAVAVLLNTELRGAFLRHQLQNAGVALAVVDGGLVEAVGEVAGEVPLLRRLVPVGPLAGDPGALELVDWGSWRRASEYAGPPPAARDVACIMYTSGTTGPSKGVLMPHAHCTLYGIGTIEAVELSHDDRYYIVLPLFHANGLLMQLGATLLAGIPAILRPRFSASSWLGDVRTHGATVTNMLGAVAAFVAAQPATQHDRDHRLRAIMTAPNHPAHEAVFRERYGVRDVLSGFGMTEVNIPIWGRIGKSCPGAAGWVYAKYFDVVIADPETDQPVAPGEVGEILVRPKAPFGFMAGYHAMPEKTVEAWRNLWFHTGDAAVMDETGLVTYVDRIKDCIRRRGENISASEIEALVAAIPGVAEVAAYAVPSDIPGGEDEVMLAVVPAPGTQLSIEELGAKADAVLPRFARPRYVEFLDALPKTPTGKVQREMLKKRGRGSAVDREAAR